MLIQNYIVDELLSLRRKISIITITIRKMISIIWFNWQRFVQLNFVSLLTKNSWHWKKFRLIFIQNNSTMFFFKETNEHKRINIYKRMKRFNFFNNIKILSFRLIFKVKRNFHEKIKKLKIRWYAREYKQFHDIDFNEIYVSIVKLMTYKIIFVMIVYCDEHALNKWYSEMISKLEKSWQNSKCYLI